MSQQEGPHRSPVRAHWERAKEDFVEGARSFRRDFSVVRLEARRHWAYIKEEIRDGSGGLWQEFRLQVRQLRCKWKGRSGREEKGNNED